MKKTYVNTHLLLEMLRYKIADEAITSEEYDNILQSLYSYDDNIRELLVKQQDILELYEKIDKLQGLLEVVNTENHLCEGFRLGFLFALEIFGNKQKAD